jgi:hypothetical protein
MKEGIGFFLKEEGKLHPVVKFATGVTEKIRG